MENIKNPSYNDHNAYCSFPVHIMSTNHSACTVKYIFRSRCNVKKKYRKIKPMRKENSIKSICFWSDSAFLYYACTDAIQKLDFFKRDVHESL